MNTILEIIGLALVVIAIAWFSIPLAIGAAGAFCVLLANVRAAREPKDTTS